jgi:hypothetical protein
MACAQIADCPLFPNLKSSLAGWRTHYCDADEAWLNCARYTRRLAGKPVPVALLPNGKLAQILLDPGGVTAVARRGTAAGAPDAAGLASASCAAGAARAGRSGSVVLAERPAVAAARRSSVARLLAALRGTR